MMSVCGSARLAGVLCALLTGLVSRARAGSLWGLGGWWVQMCVGFWSEQEHCTDLCAQINPAEADMMSWSQYGPDTLDGRASRARRGTPGSGSEGVEVSEPLNPVCRPVAFTTIGSWLRPMPRVRHLAKMRRSPRFPRPRLNLPIRARMRLTGSGPPQAFRIVVRMRWSAPLSRLGGDASGESFGQTLASETGETRRVHVENRVW